VGKTLFSTGKEKNKGLLYVSTLGRYFVNIVYPAQVDNFALDKSDTWLIFWTEVVPESLPGSRHWLS
jgi:hypothetical protein